MRLFGAMFVLLFAATAEAQDYEWCPAGRTWAEAKHCIEVSYDPKGYTPGTGRWLFRNTCNKVVHVHYCAEDARSVVGQALLCGDPKLPKEDFRLEPAGADDARYLVSQDNQWWAVSCE